MLFDYVVEERELHNLIWVYNAGLKADPKGKDVEGIDYAERRSSLAHGPPEFSLITTLSPRFDV